MSVEGPIPNTASWRLAPWVLRSAFLVPVALLASAWIWSYLAWQSLPDVSRGTVEEQDVVLFWAAELPVVVCGGLAALLGACFVVYVMVKRHWWLAAFLVVYDGFFLFGTLLAMFGFIPFKPSGW